MNYKMLVNAKLDISGSKRIAFEYYKINCPCSFLVTQLNKVGSIGILVLWEVCENLYCQY